MHLQFLVEDQSGGILVDAIMEKIIEMNPEVTYKCKPFKGIGGLTNRNTVKETKSGKLLNDLATYLKAFNAIFQYFPSALIVVVDNDTRDTEDFLHDLQEISSLHNITMDHVFCIAIEEMEAWLLGDREALCSAYPAAKTQFIDSYEQDSICGTWEVLAEAVYPGGLKKMKKECLTFFEIGKCKCEWARNIGSYMDINRNESMSFNFFINEIKKRTIG